MKLLIFVIEVLRGFNNSLTERYLLYQNHLINAFPVFHSTQKAVIRFILISHRNQ